VSHTLGLRPGCVGVTCGVRLGCRRMSWARCFEAVA
jgi:hypothetical protein